MQYLLSLIHKLEQYQHDLRFGHYYEAARSLEGTIELLRKDFELQVVEHENRYEKRLV